MNRKISETLKNELPPFYLTGAVHFMELLLFIFYLNFQNISIYLRHTLNVKRI